MIQSPSGYFWPPKGALQIIREDDLVALPPGSPSPNSREVACFLSPPLVPSFHPLPSPAAAGERERSTNGSDISMNLGAGEGVRAAAREALPRDKATDCRNNLSSCKSASLCPRPPRFRTATRGKRALPAPCTTSARPFTAWPTGPRRFWDTPVERIPLHFPHLRCIIWVVFP